MNAGGVHFSAGKNTREDLQAPYNVAGYTLMWSNFGGGFNMDSGEFTAPIAGLYRFTMSCIGWQDPNGIFDVNVRLGSDPTFDLELSQIVPGSNVNRVSGTWDMVLSENDVVYLEVQRGTLRTHANVPIIFTGYLVKEVL